MPLWHPFGPANARTALAATAQQTGGAPNFAPIQSSGSSLLRRSDPLQIKLHRVRRLGPVAAVAGAIHGLAVSELLVDHPGGGDIHSMSIAIRHRTPFDLVLCLPLAADEVELTAVFRLVWVVVGGNT